jgi:hypothetical protein
VGGLVGGVGGTISDSFATGKIKVHYGAFGGGLVGGTGTSASISNSYATGSAGDGDVAAGGFIGFMQGGTVGSSYSTGRAKSEKFFGGLVGRLASGTFSNSYWDTTTSKDKDPVGDAKTFPGITGETTTQLQSGLPTGFDPTIWAENPSINNGLPYLIANPPQ